MVAILAAGRIICLLNTQRKRQMLLAEGGATCDALVSMMSKLRSAVSLSIIVHKWH
jgi:hypothetical protein